MVENTMLKKVSIGLVLWVFISFTTVSFAAPVTQEQVRTAVETFVSLRFPVVPGTDTARTRTAVGVSYLAVASVEPLLQDEQPIGFVAHLEPSGYVLVRADDVCPPLKLYSESGNFAGLPPDFAAILRWELAEELALLQTVQQKKAALERDFTDQWAFLLNPDPVSRVKERFSTKDLRAGGPLLSTAWNQREPYNYYAPSCPGRKAPTGCVTVAFAQILRYHQWPTAISENYTYTDSIVNEGDVCTGTYSASQAGLGNYAWSSMPTSVSTSSPTAQQQAVGQLMYHCAVTVDMNFESGASGAPSSSVVAALRNYFSYESGNLEWCLDYTDAVWYAKLDTDIVNRRPVYYAFSAWIDNESVGHAVVVHGTRNGNEILINMGWGGTANGWYNMTNIVDHKGREWINHRAIFGIRPKSNGQSYLLWTKGSSSSGTCSSPIVLRSGMAYNGTTVGGVSNFTTYNCTSWNESGPEKVHRITTTTTGTITAALTNLTVDLDVFILNACSQNSCKAYGNSTATYSNAPAGTYYIVADGYFGAKGTYTLKVTHP